MAPFEIKKREEWLARLNELIAILENWAKELDWSSRRISKKMTEVSLGGEYSAPGLLMQKEFAKILVEPIGSSSPNSEGIVDIYLMPAYDDIATLYFSNGSWRIHFLFHDEALPIGHISTDNFPSRELTKQSLKEVLERMSSHVS